MSLRPAVPGRHGQRPHRYETVAHRSVQAHIDGEWVAATLTGRMQPHDGGQWEVCLAYAQAPGQNVIGWFVEDRAYLRADDTAEEGPPKIDQVPDANIPADLIALKRARIAATEKLKALPKDAPSEQRQELREAERAAFQALTEHPAYDATPWADLEAAARVKEPPRSD